MTSHILDSQTDKVIEHMTLHVLKSQADNVIEHMTSHVLDSRIDKGLELQQDLNFLGMNTAKQVTSAFISSLWINTMVHLHLKFYIINTHEHTKIV